MGKFRFRAYLDQGLCVLLIMAGAAMSAVLEVRGVKDAIATGRYGLGASVAATAPQSPRAPVAAASAPRTARAGTLLAGLTR